LCAANQHAGLIVDMQREGVGVVGVEFHHCLYVLPVGLSSLVLGASISIAE
jgi:hypothetical protein